jgi:uncharacterized protein (TIGR03437 family)
MTGRARDFGRTEQTAKFLGSGRRLRRVAWGLCALWSGSLALAQQYTISTLAGGAPPVTPVAATSAIGQVQRVAVDATGNLYFSSGNCIFKITQGVIHLFAGNSRAGFSGDGGPAVDAQLTAPQGMAIDAAGNVYIADTGNNRIRLVSSKGIISTFAGNGVGDFGGDGGPATIAELNLPAAVAVGHSGNVYIADTANHCIRLVTTNGAITTFAGIGLSGFYGFSGDGGPAVEATVSNVQDVTVDSSGNVYIADSGAAAVREVNTSGIINSIAGIGGSFGFSGDGGAATSAQLETPAGVAVDAAGNIYVLTSSDGRVREINASGIINTIAGNGSFGFFGDGGPAIDAEFTSPNGLALDSAANLYVADTGNERIRKFTAGGTINTIVGNGANASSYSGDGGPAARAQLNGPKGAAVDAAGNVYIADTGNNRVRVVSSQGVITTLAGTGAAGFSGDNGPAAGAQLNQPFGLAVDAAGNLYIADFSNNRVRKVSSKGVITTVAGTGTPGDSGDGGQAASAQLNTPTGVAVDAAGNLYISEFNSGLVRKVSPQGVIRTIAGNGTPQLSIPAGLAVDASGNVYVADAGNNVVREISPAGAISTFAGGGTGGYPGDGGPATQAQLQGPAGVAVDAAGNVYITESSSRIRKVYQGGLIVTIEGDQGVGYSGDGGPASNAQINSPAQIAVDEAGNLYVADTGNSALRLLKPNASGISVGAVANAASNLAGPVAPGEIVVLYGSELGPPALVPFALNGNERLPLTLAGTTVYFNGTAAPVLYVWQTQVAAVVPYATTGTSVEIVVQVGNQFAAPLVVPVAATAPGIFTLDYSGKGQANAVNQDGSLNGPGNPASVGSTISLYVTGEGQTNPAGQDGVLVTAPGPQPVAPVKVTIGGQAASVQAAAEDPLQVAGILRIDVQIPSGTQAGNAVPVTVSVGGVAAQTGTTIAVSQ